LVWISRTRASLANMFRLCLRKSTTWPPVTRILHFNHRTATAQVSYPVCTFCAWNVNRWEY